MSWEHNCDDKYAVHFHESLQVFSCDQAAVRIRFLLHPSIVKSTKHCVFDENWAYIRAKKSCYKQADNFTGNVQIYLTIIGSTKTGKKPGILLT
jgi:hypothetical protein